MENNEFEKGKKFSFINSINYADKAVVSKQVLTKGPGNISLFAFDKGEGLSEHTAPYDAMVYVIDGKADIVLDGVPNILETGESIIMRANIPHAIKAIEKFKMILIMIKDN